MTQIAGIMQRFLGAVKIGRLYLSSSGITGYTALAGGGQTGATLLSATLSNIVVAGSGGIDSVQLPIFERDSIRIINNATAHSIQLFSNTGDTTSTINGTAGTTGISVPANTLVFVIGTSGANSSSNGTWVATTGSTAGAGSFTTLVASGLITASGGVSAGAKVTLTSSAALICAGTSAGTATAITAQYNVIPVTTGAGAGALGAMLPATTGGDLVFVQNLSGYATTAVSIYPQTGGTIDAGSASAAVLLTTAHRALFLSVGTNIWLSFLLDTVSS